MIVEASPVDISHGERLSILLSFFAQGPKSHYTGHQGDYGTMATEYDDV